MGAVATFKAVNPILLAEKQRQIFLAEAEQIELSAPTIRSLPSDQDFHELEVRLGYHFKQQSLLRLALLHGSAGCRASNTRLAWVGDAALTHVITELLSCSLPDSDPGVLSKLRSSYISRETYRQQAAKLGLQRCCIVGLSMRQDDLDTLHGSWLPETFEALFGAVHVDAGIDTMRSVYATCFPLVEVDLLQQIMEIKQS